MDMEAQNRPAGVAYQDLLCRHPDERAAGLLGTIEERGRNGRTYLCDRLRIGTAMTSRCLGEDRRACAREPR